LKLQQREGWGQKFENYRSVFNLSTQAAQSSCQHTAVIQYHAPSQFMTFRLAGTHRFRRSSTHRFADQAGFIEKFVPLKYLFTIPLSPIQAKSYSYSLFSGCPSRSRGGALSPI
jgi:hypothetical protein